MSTIKKNEAKLIKAVRELQNSIFGLESRYTGYCYSRNGNSLTLDTSKMSDFVNEMMNLVKTDKMFCPELEQPIADFFLIVIHYMDCTFSVSEQKLSSFKKLADTVRKESAEEISTFDILITDQKEHMNSTSYETYEKFTAEIALLDQDAFYFCIKHALEQFADIHILNCLQDDEETERIAERITRMARSIAFEYRRGLHTRRNDYHD